MKILSSYQNIQIETLELGSLSCNSTLIYHQETLEALLIDPGDRLPEALSLLNNRSLKLKTILHTHAHFDHIGCSHDLREQTKANLLLHQDDREMFLNLKTQGLFFGLDLKNPQEADHYIKDKEIISGLNVPTLIETFHTPGHTEGSCVFFLTFFGQPILLSGDTLFYESIGRTDLPGGNPQKIMKSLKEKILSLPDHTIVIPGHGPRTTIEHEKNSNPFLRKLF